MSAINHQSAASEPFDPFSEEFRRDPTAWYDFLHANSPGLITMEGVPSAYVATFEHTLAVLRDAKSFSSKKPRGLPGMERVDAFNGQPVMNYADDPEHARRRKIVAPAFARQRVEEVEQDVSAVIDALLEPIRPGQSVDFFKEVCQPFGLRVVLGLFIRMPEADWPIFQRMVAAIALLDKVRPGEGKPQEYLDAWDAGREYCRKAAMQARAADSQNLISAIVAAQEGGALTDDEMMAMIMVLFIGGFPTIAGASAAALYRLAQNPDIAERIRQNPSLAKPHFEETVRFDPPVMNVLRFATDDVDLGGKTIPKGTPVYALLSACNRDPRQFPEPDRFDIDRENLLHLGFGFGVHVCIGNVIARAVIPRLVAAVAQRYPVLHLDPAAAVVWDTTPRSRHLSFLPLLT